MHRVPGLPDSLQELEPALGEKTKNSGTYQNPPDLAPTAYNIIRYSEVPSEKNPVRWLFVSRRCMHCGDAGCMKICPAPGALYRTKEGAVAYRPGQVHRLQALRCGVSL